MAKQDINNLGEAEWRAGYIYRTLKTFSDSMDESMLENLIGQTKILLQALEDELKK